MNRADPRHIVASIYHGLSDHEVVADDTSRGVKQNLSQPLIALYPQLADSKRPNGQGSTTDRSA